MRQIWLHPKLYQLLPVAYLLSGMLMIAMFGDEPFGLISGIMLCTAGILILALRIHAGRKSTTPKR